MPFRLLGLVVDPSRAGELCGHTFAHYQAAGADVTLACVAAEGVGREAAKGAAERAGIKNLVLLDFTAAELTETALEPMLTDLIAGVAPHVVVADASDGAVCRAVAAACRRARAYARGTGALPAKLYYASSQSTQPHEITTAVRTASGGPHELFSRVFPSPWVTGVLERDLFAGIAPESGTALDELLAS